MPTNGQWEKGFSRCYNEKQRTMQTPLTSGNGTAQPRFRVDDLEVDVGTAEVMRGGEKIALPKLSFDLLCALINAAPAIVTNDDLLEQVWPGLRVSPESVAQRVKLLRSAIGDDSQQPRYILGVRGRGYRLVPVPVRLAESRLSIAEATNPPINAASLTERAGATQRTIREKSIAVLPFADMSEKKDQEYFGDGMAEEIINLLVKIPGLKVIGRTSSFQFKGRNEDLRTIGTQLGVAYILEGSVRKSGDRIRVVAQLIDGREGTHMWSQTYDRDLSDALKMQDEIAAALVRAMQIEVSAADFVSRPALRNTQAYTLFLQGLHAFERYDQRGFEQAVSYYQRALDLDPSIAGASVGLAAAYGNLGAFGFLPPAVAYEQARRAAELALRLDSKSALAHALLGSIHGTYDWDWTAANRELKQALALAPSDAAILALSAYQSLIIGCWDDGLKLINTSLEEDPLNPMCYLFLHYVQLRRGRPAEAEAAIRRSLEISPTFNFARYNLGIVLLARGQTEPALAEFLKEPADAGRLVGSAMAYFGLGHIPESDSALAQLLVSYAPYVPSGIAAVYAFRGESDEAFKWLERAHAQRDSLLSRIKFTTEFDKLHDDPRYKAFLQKMNLPEG
jgi:TolB-like protein